MRDGKARRDYERAVRDSGDRFLMGKWDDWGHDHSGRLWGLAVVGEHLRRHHGETVDPGESVQDLHVRHDALHAEPVEREPSVSTAGDKEIDSIGQSRAVEDEARPPRSNLVVASLLLAFVGLLAAGGAGWVAWEAQSELAVARSDVAALEDSLAIQAVSLLSVQGQLRNSGLEGLKLRVSQLEEITANHDFALNTLVAQGTSVPSHAHTAEEIGAPIFCGGEPAMWGVFGLSC